MILIPIGFICHFYSLNRYSNARNEFVTHFIPFREKIPNEARAVLRDNKNPDFNERVDHEAQG